MRWQLSQFIIFIRSHKKHHRRSYIIILIRLDLSFTLSYLQLFANGCQVFKQLALHLIQILVRCNAGYSRIKRYKRSFAVDCISPAARPSAPVEATEVTNTRVQRHHSFFYVFLISTGVLSLKLRVFSLGACYFSILFTESAGALDKNAILPFKILL